jgi:hypothetical protein
VSRVGFKSAGHRFLGQGRLEVRQKGPPGIASPTERPRLWDRSSRDQKIQKMTISEI